MRTLASLIVTELRLPRTVLAIAVGATLGLCGAALQGLTRNPLAEPGLLGVSAGASLGAVIAIYFGISSYATAAIPAFGLVGRAGRHGADLRARPGRRNAEPGARGRGRDRVHVRADPARAQFGAEPAGRLRDHDVADGFAADRSWDHVLLSAPFIIIGCGMLAFTGRALDALSLGEVQAESLGIDLARLRLMALIGTAMAVGAATSVTGTVGFIGLVGPHIVRPFVGYQPSRILLPAAIAGAVLLLGADVATRLIRFGPEMRLGVFTALLGTPFFFWLVVRLRKMCAMTQIEASDLVISRGGRAIVRNVSLRAQGGELVALIGANGAGKSTLLTSLAGLLAPDSGAIRVNGLAISQFSRVEIARRRAYLPQNPRCEWPISVERLIALGLTPTLPAFGGLPAAFEARITEMLTQWDLLPQREQSATTLSGGELARAMLARALVGDPDILIADEPISGLDPKHALDTLARLRDLARNGKLVIISIHDLTLAARYATRLVVIDHGRIVAEGPPGEILTADLLRTVFEVEACVSGVNGGAYVDYLAPLNPSSAASARRLD